MSHLKTHAARMFGAVTLLISLVAVGTPALASATTARVAASTPSLATCENYSKVFTITASKSNPAPGEIIHLIGKNFPPNSVIPLTVNGSTSIGSATTDATGSFDFAWTVPANAQPNETFTFNGNCASLTTTTTVQVSAVTVGTTVPGSTQPLPSTGSSNTMPLLGTGIGLVVVGGLILLALRKRTERSAHAA